MSRPIQIKVGSVGLFRLLAVFSELGPTQFPFFWGGGVFFFEACVALKWLPYYLVNFNFIPVTHCTFSSAAITQ